MNVFRFFGDLSHLVSIFILIHKITKSKSTSGLSFKTQLLYFIVFVTRYLDLITGPYVSFYNTVMKLFFIGSSGYVLYLMKYKFRASTANVTIDTVGIEYLIGGSAILALIFNYKFTVIEILWSFSLWLESVAILPQLFMVQRTGEAETITTHYIFSLGVYRACYIPNWIYRYFSSGRFDVLSFVTGLIQTALYADFFYIYYTKVMKGLKFELPS